ncbi:hypothetical protein [Pseudomonas sp. NPDC089401]|uniref:hypothetical protein n=1 Tax=Pseudomonas sp. NPDC089401 TaxID=3364462 RepID=UPI0037F6EC97
MDQPASVTAAVTATQLADLCSVTRSALCHHDDLPSHFITRIGKRDQHVYALSDLAAFAYDQTAHLTEAECRLRLALARRTEPARTRSGKFGPFYLTENPDGTFAMRRQLDLADLTFQEQRDLRVALTQQEQQP